MFHPKWQNLNLYGDVLREPTPDNSQIVLWLRQDSVDGFQQWERIGNVIGAEIKLEHGLFRAPATVIRTRQKVQGFFDKLLGRFRKPHGARSWLLPDGSNAEQVGERENGRQLLWADDATILDESDVRERLGSGWQCRKLGINLFMATKTETLSDGMMPDAALEQVSLLEQAKALLAIARQAGDCHKQGLPLVDLGIICVQNGKIPQAIDLLERAVSIARKYGDQPLESDAQTNLATALLAAGQPEKAKELLEIELAHTRTIDARFQEKLVLGYLASVHAKLRDHVQAIASYQHALALARELGDGRHEADILWQLAIQHAELGLRDEAIADGRAAIERLRASENPKISVYSEQLVKYVFDGVAGGLDVQHRGPNLLRMAVSAAKAMMDFVGSGMKVVSRDMYLQRLDTCGGCTNHTGVRCKVCGCFTSVKARLPHEKCPVGKWTE
jgi:tetratricopeptide (TPR) repeat protein